VKKHRRGKEIRASAGAEIVPREEAVHFDDGLFSFFRRHSAQIQGMYRPFPDDPLPFPASPGENVRVFHHGHEGKQPVHHRVVQGKAFCQRRTERGEARSSHRGKAFFRLAPDTRDPFA